MRSGRAGLIVLVVLAVAGCGRGASPPVRVGSSLGSPSLSSSVDVAPVQAASTRGSSPRVSEKPPVPLTAPERRAGLRSRTVAWSGGGRLRIVPGSSAAPGAGRVYRIRVEVESGLDIDLAAFAAYVLATLNDQRSWTENGRRRFARTDGAADIRVVLASPKLSAAICRPLRTFGKLSCREGAQAVLTTYRWVKAIPEYAGNHDGYRHYVVNHEVGHALGHGHEYCAGKGRMAPVMMQQTKGLQGCRPNPWPHP